MRAYKATEFERDINSTLSDNEPSKESFYTAMKVAEMAAKKAAKLKGVFQTKGKKFTFYVRIAAINYADAVEDFKQIAKVVEDRTEWNHAGIQEHGSSQFELTFTYRGSTWRIW